MTVIESKRRKIENILKTYPDAIIAECDPTTFPFN